ncbi:MAG: hypothetical protein Q7S32_03120 [bacterium]|nr:hypothetical protein [bacterium]
MWFSAFGGIILFVLSIVFSAMGETGYAWICRVGALIFSVYSIYSLVWRRQRRWEGPRTVMAEVGKYRPTSLAKKEEKKQRDRQAKLTVAITNLIIGQVDLEVLYSLYLTDKEKKQCLAACYSGLGFNPDAAKVKKYEPVIKFLQS